MNRVEYGKERERPARKEHLLPVFPGSAPYPGTDKEINKPKCWHHKGQREKVGQRQKKSKPH